MIKQIWPGFVLVGCAGVDTINMDSLTYREISAGDYTIVSWGRLTNSTEPVYIYIEGDGHAFNASGRPTSDPTPRGTTMREIALRDHGSNVVYLARPCQFVLSDKCSVTDWTSGRFSSQIIESMSIAVKDIAQNRPIVLIGYSGGALVSGLIIHKHPELNVRKWVTIAGVLNHADWTEYFGDRPLSHSLNLGALPRVPQVHYVGENDKIVPLELSTKWIDGALLYIVPGASHDDFGGFSVFGDE
ncbi:MAG: hypothetical protein KBS86_02405 [Proteobacteria bacterium]|nr:hypothetical protein [Candidatus Enterousia scatequi]